MTEYEHIYHEEPITAEELAMMTDDDIAKEVTFCSCCSPFDIATSVLKAKKKSKPFHGYNPNKHHRKGSNLKPPVTTKPSKLKAGSKKAKRRKSFCARMGGVKGPTSKKGKLTPKGAALKRWNC
jgi:hypothetical protein